jgi:hypothetical protein
LRGALPRIDLEHGERRHGKRIHRGKIEDVTARPAALAGQLTKYAFGYHPVVLAPTLQ